MKILVLSGGISHERDVSLKSGRRLADALSETGQDVEIREPDELLLDYLKQSKPDLIWSVLHGSVGEDGTLQSIFELLDIKFVGAGSAAARTAWHKPSAKSRVAAAGIATPRGVVLPKSAFKELNTEAILGVIVDSLGLPLMVKPARSGSAQGVSKVEDKKRLSKAMVDAYAYGEEVLVETFIPGTEVAITVVMDKTSTRALPAVEIEPINGSFGFQERYTAGETNYYVPARLSPEVSARALSAALTAHQALDLGQLSRIDMIIDSDGTAWFLEASVNPGLTETSLSPQALVAGGDSLAYAYLAIATQAIG